MGNLPSFGTGTTFDTLAASTLSVARFGVDEAWDAIASLLTTFNDQVKEVTGQMVDRTTNRLRRYGGGQKFRIQRTDEMGQANAQKLRVGSTVGFPFEKYEIAVQYTRSSMKIMKANQLAADVQAVTTAFYQGLLGNIKVALLGGTNKNFVDYLVDHLDSQFSIPVKALVNADGAPIPPGPNGESFNAGTHTHYLASATLTNAWLHSVIDTVIEHNKTGTAVLWINKADEAAVSALADFKAVVYATTQRSANQEYGIGDLDPNALNNRHIGYFGGATVWVKPFWPATYYFCYMSNNGSLPLAMRIRGEDEDTGGDPVEGAGDVNLIFEDEDHPLIAKSWEQEYGIGVWYRTSAAVGYVGGTAYLIPDMTTFFD